jgi:hypothetical protein
MEAANRETMKQRQNLQILEGNATLVVHVCSFASINIISIVSMLKRE